MNVNDKDEKAPLCARVFARNFDRLVEGDDLGVEPLLAEHLGSCVTCFRALTELRDAPRVAAALRADPSMDQTMDERFWDELAARTTAATEAALRGGRVTETASSARSRARRPVAARAWVFSVAAAVAAAAGWAVIAHPPGRAAAPVIAPAPLASAVRLPAASPGPLAPADEAASDEADVADLDASALRQLLDRMQPHAPAALTSSKRSEAVDSAEVVDDETGLNDELADLDGDELRRVASSLEAGAW